MSDDHIIDMFFDRDQNSIEELRKKYENRLTRISMNFLNNKQDAEECVSDTLLKAWQNIPPQRPEILSAYLSKITRNISLNKLKAKNTQKRGSGEYTAVIDELEYAIPTFKSNTPEEIYEANQTTKAINDFLLMVKKNERIVFVLRYFYGESLGDIADRFNYSESKTKSLLFRIRKKLKAYLEKEGVLL